MRVFWGRRGLAFYRICLPWSFPPFAWSPGKVPLPSQPPCVCVCVSVHPSVGRCPWWGRARELPPRTGYQKEGLTIDGSRQRASGHPADDLLLLLETSCPCWSWGCCLARAGRVLSGERSLVLVLDLCPGGLLLGSEESRANMLSSSSPCFGVQILNLRCCRTPSPMHAAPALPKSDCLQGHPGLQYPRDCKRRLFPL